jgi:ABC-2 type transport system ATP-binding protein
VLASALEKSSRWMAWICSARELFALLGQNGAGKTTAISLLLGQQQPDAGTAVLFGRSPLEIEARRKIGVMMQEAALVPELRVREQIELVASYYLDPMMPAAVMQLGSSLEGRSARCSLP